MSAKSTSTNEQIIDDLTHDLRDAQFTKEDEVKDTSPDIPEDSEEVSPTSPDSDDEELKHQELDLTDEEKEAKHQEALTLKTRGNEQFKSDEFLESINTYTDALRLCPLKYSSDRAVLYSNRAAARSKLEEKASAIEDCTKAITLNGDFVRAYLRRAKLYEDSDKLDESLEDYKKILELDPGNRDALAANHRLPPMINERNEKMKEEMFGKLKDLGNLFLRPFGLSTNNFQMQQDPNTGGYSVNFQQNPAN